MTEFKLFGKQLMFTSIFDNVSAYHWGGGMIETIYSDGSGKLESTELFYYKKIAFGLYVRIGTQ